MFSLIVAAAIAAAPPADPGADSSAAIALAESRGLRLYQAYRIAPYAVAKAGAVLKNRISETSGYVTTTAADRDQILTFIGRSGDDKPYAIWRGRYRDGAEIEGSLIERADSAATLTADEVAAFSAERAALSYVISNQSKLGPMSCAGDVMPNMIVLPPTKSDPMFAVYIMTPQTDKNVVPLGGHVRVVLDQNSHVQSLKRLTEGCHDIDLLHDGARLAADWVGHRSERTPNEAHVFASLATDAKIMVDTGQKPYWKVDKGKIGKDDTPPAR